MSICSLSQGQLEFLSANQLPEEAYYMHNAAVGPAFELLNRSAVPIANCQQEDKRRANALRLLLPSKLGKRAKQQPGQKQQHANVYPQGITPEHVNDLAALLDRIGSIGPTQPFPSSLASSVYIRNRRIGVLGAVLEVIGGKLEFAWLTGANTNWQFSETEHWANGCARARADFANRLDDVGALTAPGFLAAYLNVYFHPETGRFVLRYRGVVGGEKLQHIRQSSGPSADKQQPTSLKIYPMTDLPRQIPTLMPMFLRNRIGTSDGLNSNGSARHHTMYLLWLSQHTLADLWLINGAHYWDGRLRLNNVPAQPSSPPRVLSDNTFVRHVLPRPAPKAPAQSLTRQKPADRAYPGI